MIDNYWYAILESKQVRQKPVSIKRMGQDLVFWREANDHVVCMIDRCPHRGAALSLGRVRSHPVQGNCIECPYHGFQYNGEGQCTLIPCNGKAARIPPGFEVKTFPTRDAQGFIWIWWTASHFSTPPSTTELPTLPRFEELSDNLAHTATTSQVWKVHYARIMESNFDVHHFPFVHRSINPGIGTLVDPYQVEMDGDLIRTSGQLRQDNGKSAEESPGWFFKISVLFPQLTLIELTSKIRLLLVVTPIDEETSWVAIRYYQDYVRVPLLGWLVSWLILMVEFKVLQEPQDLPVLRSLRPRHTSLRANKLVAADAGSAHYLRRYEQQLRHQTTESNETADNPPVESSFSTRINLENYS